MPIDRNHLQLVISDTHSKNIRVGNVAEPQAQALTGFDRDLVINLPIERQNVAVAPAVCTFMDGTEAGTMNLPILLQAPVVEDKYEILVDFRRCRLLDNQNAMQSARDLLRRQLVWVIPECPGVGTTKPIVISFPRPHGLLCKPGDSIHGIGNAYAMPVNCSWLLQIIDQSNAQFVALANAQHGPRNSTVITPDVRRCLVST